MFCETGWAELPHRSVAENVRTKLEARVHELTSQAVEPEPESENVMVTRVQPFCVAVAVPVELGSVEPPQGTVAVAGAIKVGATRESMTRMVWLREVPAPDHVRVMMVIVPSAAQLPAEVESENVTDPVVPHWPVETVAVPVTLGSVEVPQGTVVSAGIWSEPPTVVTAKLMPLTPPTGTLTERGLALLEPEHKPNDAGTLTE